MDFYQNVGKMALGSRLRRLSELLTGQAAEVYALYNVDIQPKWFPVFYVLSTGEEKSISQIAQQIGHSHPSVSTIVKEMEKRGVLTKGSSKGDKRENYVKLTEKGFDINQRVRAQYLDVGSAVDKAMNETQNDLWAAIGEWEYLLKERNLLTRVRDEKKIRESGEISIIDYHPEYIQAFTELNKQWITQYFKMEPSDHKYLDHAEENIIHKGGAILFALREGKAVGTCALIPLEDNTFELAKMAVSPTEKGRGIGYQLGRAAIEKAKANGAKRLYLESNTILTPALSLYQKLGFKRITGKPSPYQRSNIQMELML
jgi:DNA-binding MarR family transcriptional regulator/N-acetylglutamate synthase-like GNAT family acetyltransferase